jgi:hypothetical protein
VRDLTGEHDGLDVVAAHGLLVLVLEPGDDCSGEGADPRAALEQRIEL